MGRKRNARKRNRVSRRAREHSGFGFNLGTGVELGPVGKLRRSEQEAEYRGLAMLLSSCEDPDRILRLLSTEHEEETNLHVCEKLVNPDGPAIANLADEHGSTMFKEDGRKNHWHGLSKKKRRRIAKLAAKSRGGR